MQLVLNKREDYRVHHEDNNDEDNNDNDNNGDDNDNDSDNDKPMAMNVSITTKSWKEKTKVLLTNCEEKRVRWEK